jgi:hypothetical protein
MEHQNFYFTLIIQGDKKFIQNLYETALLHAENSPKDTGLLYALGGDDDDDLLVNAFEDIQYDYNKGLLKVSQLAVDEFYADSAIAELYRKHSDKITELVYMWYYSSVDKASWFKNGKKHLMDINSYVLASQQEYSQPLHDIVNEFDYVISLDCKSPNDGDMEYDDEGIRCYWDNEIGGWITCAKDCTPRFLKLLKSTDFEGFDE